jgi:hypothetical protein
MGNSFFLPFFFFFFFLSYLSEFISPGAKKQKGYGNRALLEASIYTGRIFKSGSRCALHLFGLPIMDSVLVLVFAFDTSSGYAGLHHSLSLFCFVFGDGFPCFIWVDRLLGNHGSQLCWFTSSLAVRRTGFLLGHNVEISVFLSASHVSLVQYSAWHGRQFWGLDDTT